MAGKVVVGDALEALRSMRAGCVRGAVTSPPYNLRRSTGNFPKTGGSWPGAEIMDGYDGCTDDLPRADYVSWQRAVVGELMRVIEPDGALFYNCKPRVQAGLVEDPMDVLSGFPVRQAVVWHKGAGVNWSRSFFVPAYELVYLVCREGFRLPKASVTETDVWRIAPESGPRVGHPAPFPLALARRCVAALGGGGCVLDPFLGSGTTAVAADEAGADWIGVEQSPVYAARAEARIAAARAAAAGSLLAAGRAGDADGPRRPLPSVTVRPRTQAERARLARERRKAGAPPERDGRPRTAAERMRLMRARRRAEREPRRE